MELTGASVHSLDLLGPSSVNTPSKDHLGNSENLPYRPGTPENTSPTARGHQSTPPLPPGDTSSPLPPGTPENTSPTARGHQLSPTSRGHQLSPIARGHQLSPTAQGHQLSPTARGHQRTPPLPPGDTSSPLPPGTPENTSPTARDTREHLPTDRRHSSLKASLPTAAQQLSVTRVPHRVTRVPHRPALPPSTASTRARTRDPHRPAMTNHRSWMVANRWFSNTPSRWHI
ncbi:unnamed protein product [Gadus morhua 'NCC']